MKTLHAILISTGCLLMLVSLLIKSVPLLGVAELFAFTGFGMALKHKLSTK